MTDETILLSKYRPDEFQYVFGQDTAVAALQNAIKTGSSRQFLFTGLTGTGKTTLARLTAQAYGCEEIMEIDGATHTGIDSIREKIQTLDLLPMVGDRRAIILDEAHRLSGNAWDACLKALEEPPPHVVWCICSTNPSKIPATVQRRCMTLALQPVPEADISYLLDYIAKQEGGVADPAIIDVCAFAADGSPARGIANLAKCLSAKDVDEARELCRITGELPGVVDLCRFLLQPTSWANACNLIKALKGQDNESVRISVCNYLAKVLESSASKSPDYAFAIVRIMDAFSQQSYRSSDGLAPIFISVVMAMWPNGPPTKRG